MPIKFCGMKPIFCHLNHEDRLKCQFCCAAVYEMHYHPWAVCDCRFCKAHADFSVPILSHAVKANGHQSWCECSECLQIASKRKSWDIPALPKGYLKAAFDKHKENIISGILKAFTQVPTTTKDIAQCQKCLARYNPAHRHDCPEINNYETNRIDGVGTDSPTVINEAGGKQSATKHAMDLMPAKALLAIAEVVKQGAVKYGVDNWRGIPVNDHLNHSLIHVYAFLAGDTSDEHLQHAACRMMMALETYIAAEEISIIELFDKKIALNQRIFMAKSKSEQDSRAIIMHPKLPKLGQSYIGRKGIVSFIEVSPVDESGNEWEVTITYRD